MQLLRHAEQPTRSAGAMVSAVRPCSCPTIATPPNTTFRATPTFRCAAPGDLTAKPVDSSGTDADANLGTFSCYRNTHPMHTQECSQHSPFVTWHVPQLRRLLLKGSWLCAPGRVCAVLPASARGMLHSALEIAFPTPATLWLACARD